MKELSREKGGKSWKWFRVGFNFQYYLVVHYNVAEIQKNNRKKKIKTTLADQEDRNIIQ